MAAAEDVAQMLSSIKSEARNSTGSWVIPARKLGRVVGPIDEDILYPLPLSFDLTKVIQ